MNDQTKWLNKGKRIVRSIAVITLCAFVEGLFASDIGVNHSDNVQSSIVDLPYTIVNKLFGRSLKVMPAQQVELDWTTSGKPIKVANGSCPSLNRRIDRDRKNTRGPKRVILLRHGQSQGNVDKSIYKHVADNALHLTDLGWKQALCAGNAMKQILRDESVRFIVSPYVRTRETFHAVAESWGGLAHVDWREDPRIREQDFGNFQDPKATEKQKQERRAFSSFYYRFPDGGESVCDVYDRVSSFFESLHRAWAEHPEVENYVLVTHGVTIAVFLMRWYKYSLEEFAKWETFGNCEFAVLEQAPVAGKSSSRLQLQYVVQNENLIPVKTERVQKSVPEAACIREMRFQ